jgi:hypothetical protein
MAWAMLAALAVLEEPLVGERNFWTTRPHPWPALLASKLVFVLVTIHLPLLLADLYVLAARGFSPANALGPILWKQLLFFGAVTLPSIALASLLRNFTHFVIAVFAIAAGIAILNDGFQRFPDFPRLEINLTHAAIRMLLAAAALAVIWTQYARRRVIPARVTAIAAMLAAASLSAWLPARASYAFIGSSSPETPRISLRSSPTVPSPSTLARFGGAQTVALLPIAIAAAPAGHFRIPFVEVEIVLPDRARLRSAVPSPNRPFERIDFTAYAFCNPPDWLALRFSGQAWERVRNARVRIHGTAAFDFCRPGETAVLFPDGSADIPGMGRCTAMTVDDRYGEQILKVFCESPRNLPAASIALRHEPSGREWRLGLNSASTYSPGPHETWLSPATSRTVLFPLDDFRRVGAGIPVAGAGERSPVSPHRNHARNRHRTRPCAFRFRRGNVSVLSGTALDPYARSSDSRPAWIAETRATPDQSISPIPSAIASSRRSCTRLAIGMGDAHSRAVSIASRASLNPNRSAKPHPRSVCRNLHTPATRTARSSHPGKGADPPPPYAAWRTPLRNSRSCSRS